MSSGRVQGAEARGTHHVPSSSIVRREDDNAKCAQNGEKKKRKHNMVDRESELLTDQYIH